MHLTAGLSTMAATEAVHGIHIARARSSAPELLSTSKLEMVTFPKLSISVGNTGPCLACKKATSTTRSLKCCVSNKGRVTLDRGAFRSARRSTSLFEDSRHLSISQRRESTMIGAGMARDASTADESRATDGVPSLEQMLKPPPNFATTCESRTFTITIHGVVLENDIRRLDSDLKKVHGLLNAWIGPIKEGGLRGGSVSVQIEVDAEVSLRAVTTEIQSLDQNLLVLPFKNQSWSWRGNKINYAVAGCGKPIVLVHGFGGNVGHFASLTSHLAENFRVYAVDLLGFGASDKPPNADYGPDLWGEQVRDFTQEIAGEGALLVGNSIGSLATLSAAALMDDKAVSGVVLLNCAGAMNRKGLEKDDALLRALSPIFIAVEFLLQRPRIATFLFNRFRTKKNIKTILSQQAYCNKEAVTDQLVDILHHPSEEPGALQVFVKVFVNEPGPRPESLMPQINVPVLLLWGGKDRWTPPNGKVANYFRKLGEERGNIFVETLPDVGHCPHDDRPELVAERMYSFIASLDQ